MGIISRFNNVTTPKNALKTKKHILKHIANLSEMLIDIFPAFFSGSH